MTTLVVGAVDYLTRLPDGLHQIIFGYLIYDEKISTITVNSFLYRLFFKRERKILLFGENTINFFTDVKFQQMILGKIYSPLDQLSVHDTYFLFHEHCKNLIDLPIPHLNGLMSLFLPIDIYAKINEAFPTAIPKVRNLILARSYDDNYDLESTWKIFPFLHRVVESIRFSGLENVPEELSLPSSIKELSFDRGSTINKLSSPLPNLRVLILFYSPIRNLNDFKYLDVLRVDQAQLSVMSDYAALTTAKKLNIEYSQRLTDISFLQENEDITIFGCGNLVNFTNCFSKSKKITIDISYESIDVDVSYYSKVEELKLTGMQLVLMNGLARGGISSSLRHLHLEGVGGFTNLIGFEHLEKVSLLKCPDITTLRGLIRVPSIHLSDLALATLDELGENKDVWVESCDNITDFSPLKYVNRVKVVSCKGFTDASHLDHVSHVTITSCDGLEDVSGLRDAKLVELYFCPLIKSVAELDHVKNLRVDCCQYLEDRKV